ncbi:MAG: DUF1153 domain-containing protein [Alphaproteobacteria bacterium]
MNKEPESTEDRRSAALTALPPPNTKRWVARRKAAVVAAVANGFLTLEDACRRYMLSAEEFASWQLAIDTHGLRGLRTTRLQEYRARARKTAGDQPGDAQAKPLAAAESRF